MTAAEKQAAVDRLLDELKKKAKITRNAFSGMKC
jgi:hypothetical protein